MGWKRQGCVVGILALVLMAAGGILLLLGIKDWALLSGGSGFVIAVAVVLGYGDRAYHQ